MAREKIDLMSEGELAKLGLQHQIAEGLLTNEVYKTLSAAEQNNVKAVLFEMYGQPVAAPVALSSLEFTVFGLAKIFFKKDSNVPLTEQEQAFYGRFKSYIEQHEMTMNAGDWYVPYAEANMLAAQENREAYKAKKLEITGDF
ncbi:hypothetical protein D3C85_970080 [compost metagenome]